MNDKRASVHLFFYDRDNHILTVVSLAMLVGISLWLDVSPTDPARALKQATSMQDDAELVKDQPPFATGVGVRMRTI